MSTTGNPSQTHIGSTGSDDSQQATDEAWLPVTSKHRYLSGLAALNISTSKRTGDWHSYHICKPPKRPVRTYLVGEGCQVNTNPIFGERGILDVTQILDEMQVPQASHPTYAANHARAIADLILAAVLAHQALDHIQLDDWMPTPQDKQEVFSLLELAHEILSEEQVAQITAWEQLNTLAD